MASLPHDLRIAARSLRQRPGFFATAVLTLALGVGAVAAIFTVYDAVLLKPLPFAHADRIARVMREQPPVTSSPVSAPMLQEWQEGSREVFDAFGAYVARTAVLRGQGEAERLTGYAVTPGFWDVFSQPVALGRAFGTEEETRNERVAVIGDALWRNRFDADPAILGREVQLDGVATRIVGVAAPGFRYPSDAQVWTPTFVPANVAGRGSASYSVIARLAPGAGIAQADAALARVTQWQAKEFPDNHTGLTARIEPLPALVGARVRAPLAVLLGAAALVLLIACANLANLTLARAQARTQELALRRAMGAGRMRLLREVMAESLLIAGVGTLAALLVAQPATQALLSLAPDLLPAYNRPQVDLRVVALTAGVALATLLLFGAWPGWRAAGVDPAQALQGASRSQTGSRRQMRARAVLVSAEIAVALTLLAGAGLLIDSLRRLGDVDPGVASAQVVTARVSLPMPVRAPGETFETTAANGKAALDPMLAAIEARLRAMPGVRSLAFTDELPVSGDTGWSGSFEVVGHPIEEATLAVFRFVGPDYFSTFGIDIDAGRAFDSRDGSQALFPTEVLVNRTFVDTYLGGADALGRQVTVYDGSQKTIVGVVEDVRQQGLDQDTIAEVYFPVRSAPMGELALAVAVDGDAMAFAPMLREALRQAVPDAPVFSIRTMDEVMGQTTAMRRFNMTLMSVFAGVALLLSAIGLYGVIAYSVGQRRREIGLRQAIGARAVDVHRLMLGAGLRMIVPGLVVGVVGALLLGRAIASQLYGVSAADPVVLGLVAGVLALVALAACAVPTLRAAKASPMDALRGD